MDQLLEQADFVFVNCAFTRETYHLIGEPQLTRMKPTAYLINTARGPVVDVDPELVRLPNVVLTPHIGSAVSDYN